MWSMNCRWQVGIWGAIRLLQLSQEKEMVAETRMLSRQRDTGRPKKYLRGKISHDFTRSSGSLDRYWSSLTGYEPCFHLIPAKRPPQGHKPHVSDGGNSRVTVRVKGRRLAGYCDLYMVSTNEQSLFSVSCDWRL